MRKAEMRDSGIRSSIGARWVLQRGMDELCS